MESSIAVFLERQSACELLPTEFRSLPHAQIAEKIRYTSRFVRVRGHANLLCIVPILTDDPRRESRSTWRRAMSLITSTASE